METVDDVEELAIPEHGSEDSRMGALVISVADIGAGRVDLVVGRAGFPNVGKNLRAGGAVLFETPDAGLLEVRLLKILRPQNVAMVRVSRVSPRNGITAGFVEHEQGNEPFAPHEVIRIRASLQAVREAAAARNDLTDDKIDLINRKLDDMAAAATRMGRKDWLNLAVGQPTNLIATAALGPDVGKFLFGSIGQALAWLVGQTVEFIP
jgi:hypothetical protein